MPAPDDLETAILALLRDRAPGTTVCPSEVARRVAGDDAWRSLMAPIREAAGRLLAAGRLDVLQRGQPVDPVRARGPIRLRAR